MVSHHHSESLLRCPVLNMLFNGRVSRILLLVVLFALLCVSFCNQDLHFKITKDALTAKEGSCVKIECNTENHFTDNQNKPEQWFWVKDPKWDENKQVFNGIVIIRKNGTNQTLAPELADRVEYTGSWSFTQAKKGGSCSLVINNLQINDSGIYKFRYQEPVRWMTDPGLNLTVEDEPCRVTVEDPPPFIELHNVTIKCFTSLSCGTYPQITGFDQTREPSHINKDEPKSSEVSFQASWLDDGRVLSCQPQGNTDTCMIRSIKLTVEYSPKETKVAVNSSDIKEGDDAILTCSSRGHPNATYTWYKDSSKIKEGTELNIQSIKREDSGSYHCKALNKHGTKKSDVVTVNVKYAPKDVTLTADKPEIKEGQDLTLTCNIKEANPSVHSYTWYKDDKQINVSQHSTYHLSNVQPENSGVYYCKGINAIGQANSPVYQLSVQYVPRQTHIFGVNQVTLGSLLSLTCNTAAYPAPSGFFWYYRHGEQSPWRLPSQTGIKQTLEWDRVALTEHGCYMCSATNDMGTGQNSSQSCIDVLYGPTQLVLSMAHTAPEGHLIHIKCEVQSFPASDLTLSWTTLHSICSLSTPPSPSQPQTVTGCLSPSTNTLQCSFNVTIFHTGVYTCRANNYEGENITKKELEITFSPREVTALAKPDPILNENRQLSFTCKACSNPPATAYTWVHSMKGITSTVEHVQNFTVNSITPSNSGLYSCTAKNSLGTGKSQQVEVKVKYAPKRTTVVHNMTTSWQSNGAYPVTLACHSHSYPPVSSYRWYVEGRESFINKNQNFTVQPNMPGTYYCVANNTLGGKESNRVELFLRRVLYQVLCSLFVIIVLLLIATFLVYRHKKKKSIDQGTSSKLQCCVHFAFLAWRSGTTENLVNDPQASSRDELYHPEPRPQCAQPSRTMYPDSTSPINTVYCVLNAPGEQQGHSQSQRLRNKGGHRGHRQDDEVIYSMVKPKGQEMSHLGKTAKGKECDIYAKVVKPTLKEKNNKQDDYENMKGACAPTLITERESSEDDMDVEINYSDVKFTAKPGHQRNHKAGRNNTSSSDDDVYETQYSDLKM